MTIRLSNTDYSSKRGPCPSGFHIPSKDDLLFLDGLIKFVCSEYSEQGSYVRILSVYGLVFISPYLYLDSGGNPALGSNAPLLASCTADSNGLYLLGGAMTYGRTTAVEQRNLFSCAFPIRPFSNTVIQPDSSRTLRYEAGGYVGSPYGTGHLAEIYRNQSLGVVSLCLDGKAKLTIADKNLGGVNAGDSGYRYQWGNGYGFPDSGTTNTDPNAIDASGYGPGNFYSSSTFITASPRDYSQNYNLWGGNSMGTRERKSVLNVYSG